MLRDLNRLVSTTWDLVIVGGGVYGAAAAWDAALRGLSVALIEQGDFGQATSANSQKIAHGGLRYLQSLDIARMRESVRERAILLRVAPHLVVPLPCLMPTTRFGLRSGAVMAAALRLNDWITCDRNQDLRDASARIPDGRIIKREECLRLIPTLRREGLTGGAVWYDGQILNSERLTLAYVLGAAARGAAAANYVRAVELLREQDQIAGVKAIDLLSQRPLEIRGRLVLNMAGPWVSGALSAAAGAPARGLPPKSFLKAINVITRPLYARRVALGLSSPQRSSQSLGLIFITPWRERSIIGTAYSAYNGDPEDCAVSEEEIGQFLRQINAAFPKGRLMREDISYVHFGLLPAANSGQAAGLRLRKRYALIDHERTQGLRGLVTALGVKYTTARDVAEKAVTLALRKLGKPASVSPSRTTPLPGGDLEDVEEFLARESRARPNGLHPAIVRHLIHAYGSAYRDVLSWIDEDRTMSQPIVGSSEVIRAEIRHAARKEMAQRLSDVVFRRTDLGTTGHPGEACLRDCAQAMAQELGWDAGRVEEELRLTRAEFRKHACVPADVQQAAAQAQVKIIRDRPSR
jgi:glycerol-3-phosphate dehydrogenase